MLGELEQIVMLAVMRAGDDAYGVPILDEIRRQTGRELAASSYPPAPGAAPLVGTGSGTLPLVPVGGSGPSAGGGGVIG